MTERVAAVAVSEAVVDANVLLRFLTEDPPAMANQADQMLRAAEDGRVALLVAPLALAEVVYVLESHYGWSRGSIVSGLNGLFSAAVLVLLERTIVEQALIWYRDMPAVHFADAYVSALAVARGHGAVVSFDRALRRVPGNHLVTRAADLDAPDV